MTDVPTMKIVAREVPPTGTFSSGTGMASATIVTSRRAQTPASVSGLGFEAAKAAAATARVTISATTTGSRTGRSRAVSRPSSARRRPLVVGPPFGPGAARPRYFPNYARQDQCARRACSSGIPPKREAAQLLGEDVELGFGLARVPAPVHDRSRRHVGDAPEGGLGVALLAPVAAERLGALVVGEDLTEPRAGDGLLQRVGHELLGALEARARAVTGGARLVVEHLWMDIVVRVRERAVFGRCDRLRRRRRPFDRHDHVALGDHPVVRGGPGGMEDRSGGVGETRPCQHVADLQEPWDAASPVLGSDLVARDREPRIVPADTDPGPEPEREGGRLALDLPFDRDDVVLVPVAQVV